MSTIVRFTLPTLGPQTTPRLSAKGGESKTLVPFVLLLLMEFCDRSGVRGQLLIESGQALSSMLRIMCERPRVLDANTRSHLLDLARTHILKYQQAGCHMVYKHHALIHLIRSSGFHGNPCFFSTYQDETENGDCAKICGSVHVDKFSEATLGKLLLLEDVRCAD